ncbi:MAG: VTC domain-containing protein, partial [Acidobacteriota bacterium]
MPRHERKYTVPEEEVGGLAAHLRQAGWRPAYSARHVNSLYFDRLDRPRYLQNVEGLGWRNKVRIRWYGDFWGRVDEPVLEVKIKAGHAGRKRRAALPAFDLEPRTQRKSLGTLLTAADLAEGELRHLEAVLATRYRRRYYVTRDRRLRLTVDDPVRYLRPPGPRGFTSRWRRDPDGVIELKYDVGREADAQTL